MVLLHFVSVASARLLAVSPLRKYLHNLTLFGGEETRNEAKHGYTDALTPEGSAAKRPVTVGTRGTHGYIDAHTQKLR